MNWQDTWRHARGLWPSWAPSPEEAAVWSQALSTIRQDEVLSALNRHKMDSPSGFPTLSAIRAICASIAADRAINEDRSHRHAASGEFEDTQAWIKRTVDASTPEERERVYAEVQAARHSPGLLAVGLERLPRRRTA